MKRETDARLDNLCEWLTDHKGEQGGFAQAARDVEAVRAALAASEARAKRMEDARDGLKSLVKHLRGLLACAQEDFAEQFRDWDFASEARQEIAALAEPAADAGEVRRA